MVALVPEKDALAPVHYQVAVSGNHDVGLVTQCVPCALGISFVWGDDDGDSLALQESGNSVD